MAIKLNAISRTNVADMVLEQLFDLFLGGHLKLGDRLPSEAELAQQLGSGRNTVREALKVLQVLGIIERRQGDGSYVASHIAIPLKPVLLSLISYMGSAIEMVELRRVLEVGLIDLVIEKINDRDIADLQQTIQALEELDGDTGVTADRLAQCDLAFHHQLLEITGDRSLIELGRLIMQLFANSIAAHLISGGVSRAVRDHRRILAAVVKRDRTAARDAVIVSYNAWKKYIKVGDIGINGDGR